MFVGNSAVDDSEPNGRVAVKYELGTSVIDGLRVPTSARIQVNENIDVKFVLDRVGTEWGPSGRVGEWSGRVRASGDRVGTDETGPMEG